MIERVSCILCDGDTALIAFVQEDNTMYFDNVLNTFQDVSITRWDAAILEQEIETARVLQEEFEKTAKKELREKKSQERKMKSRRKTRQKMKHEFEQLKEKKARINNKRHQLTFSWCLFITRFCPLKHVIM